MVQNVYIRYAEVERPENKNDLFEISRFEKKKKTLLSPENG